MLVQSAFTSGIQSLLDGSVNKGLLCRLARFHDERHRPNAKYHSHKTRGQGATAAEKEPQNYGQPSNYKADNRNMIKSQMKMGRCNEGLDHLRRIIMHSRRGKCEGNENHDCPNHARKFSTQDRHSVHRPTLRERSSQQSSSLVILQIRMTPGSDLSNQRHL